MALLVGAAVLLAGALVTGLVAPARAADPTREASEEEVAPAR